MKTLVTATALVLGLSGAAFAQAGAQESVGTNAAGSKSGVVGKGDAMETAPPTTTGTAPVTSGRAGSGEMAPGSRGMATDDPTVAPKPSNPTPGAR